MKKFVVNCDFNGQKAPFTIYIGQYEENHHPLHFQADWLGKQRGGNIPPEVLDAISRLADIAKRNNVSLEELCVYALGVAQQDAKQDEVATEGGEGIDANQAEIDEFADKSQLDDLYNNSDLEQPDQQEMEYDVSDIQNNADGDGDSGSQNIPGIQDQQNTDESYENDLDALEPSVSIYNKSPEESTALPSQLKEENIKPDE